MNKTIVSKLQELELSEKEAALYLALLALDDAPVQAVAKAANLERSTAYLLLESLAKKGFVERVGEDVRMYRACEPEALLFMADASVERARETDRLIRSTVEELELLASETPHTPRAVYFDTAEGLETLRHEIQSTNVQSIRALLHTSDFVTALSKGEDSRLIVAEKRESLKKTAGFAQTRFVPKNHYPFASNLVVYGDTILVISDTEEFAVRIESADFADVVKEAFDLAWKEAGRLDAMSSKKDLSSARR